MGSLQITAPCDELQMIQCATVKHVAKKEAMCQGTEQGNVVTFLPRLLTSLARSCQELPHRCFLVHLQWNLRAIEHLLNGRFTEPSRIDDQLGFVADTDDLGVDRIDRHSGFGKPECIIDDAAKREAYRPQAIRIRVVRLAREFGGQLGMQWQRMYLLLRPKRHLTRKRHEIGFCRYIA